MVVRGRTQIQLDALGGRTTPSTRLNLLAGVVKGSADSSHRRLRGRLCVAEERRVFSAIFDVDASRGPCSSGAPWLWHPVVTEADAGGRASVGVLGVVSYLPLASTCSPRRGVGDSRLRACVRTGEYMRAAVLGDTRRSGCCSFSLWLLTNGLARKGGFVTIREGRGETLGMQ